MAFDIDAEAGKRIAHRAQFEVLGLQRIAHKISYTILGGRCLITNLNIDGRAVDRCNPQHDGAFLRTQS